jgi:hypothetical protein
MTSPIWFAAVHPRACVPYIGTTYKTCQPTTIDFCATPHEAWRGDITYTFEAVVSNFHRMKIGVFYEPNVAQQTLIDTNVDMNKKFMQVIDLQQTRTWQVCVKWSTSKNWLLNVNTGRGMVGTSLSPVASPWGTCNGYIALIPFTSLESPDNSNIQINVYVHSDNMLFNEYTDAFMPTSRFVGQSLVTESDAPNDAPEISCFELNPSGATTDGIAVEHFGEVPFSFRQGLKRFTTTDQTNGAANALGIKLTTYTANIFPVMLPSFTTALPSYVPPSLINYLRYAYLGMRGGLRKRFRFVGMISGFDAQHVKVQFLAPGTSTLTQQVGYTNTTVAQSSIRGTLTFIPSTNGGIEFEIPFYSNNYFVWSGNDDPFNNAEQCFEPTGLRNYVALYDMGPNNQIIIASEETACGEDFNFLRFVAVPPCNIP